MLTEKQEEVLARADRLLGEVRTHIFALAHELDASEAREILDSMYLQLLGLHGNYGDMVRALQMEHLSTRNQAVSQDVSHEV